MSFDRRSFIIAGAAGTVIPRSTLRRGLAGGKAGRAGTSVRRAAHGIAGDTGPGSIASAGEWAGN